MMAELVTSTDFYNTRYGVVSTFNVTIRYVVNIDCTHQR